MTYKKIALFLCLFGCLSVFSQNESTDIVHGFFNNFEEKGATIALDELYGTNEWISRSSDAISKVKTQLEGLNEDFVGKYYGYELILEKKLSDSYILMSYLVKYDRQPIRFTFQFYKPNDTWRIQSFSFDGDLDEEIEEAAKLYRYKLD
tara:strand:- start:787 stop:1233 length:447 start_codon:yes stop_codon:yes gene_type:complete